MWWVLKHFPMSSLTYCMQPSCVWSTSPSSYAHHCVSLHVKENDRLTPLVFVAYGIIFHTKWIGEFFVLSNQFHIKFQIDSNSHEKKHLEHLLPVSTIASWHLCLICTELIKASQNDDLLHALERNIYCISVFSFQSYIHTSLSMFTVAGSAFYFERHSLSNMRFCVFWVHDLSLFRTMWSLYVLVWTFTNFEIWVPSNNLGQVY